MHYLIINNCHKKRDQSFWKIGNWRASGSVSDSHLLSLYTHKNIFNLSVVTLVPTFGVFTISFVNFLFLFMLIFSFPLPISCMIRHFLLLLVCICAHFYSRISTFAQNNNLLCSYKHHVLVE